MSTTLIITVITLSVLGFVLAGVLYLVARKFHVVEDPRIDEVEAALPGANCGGCGFAGCRAFAAETINVDDLSSMFCPVGGNECMASIAQILGKAAVEKAPEIAVIRCNGTCEARPKANKYEGASSCAIKASLYTGDTSCSYGCLGEGDCVNVCSFGALTMDKQTGLPVVDEDKCTGCGACVKACPKLIIELRKKGPKGRRIYVACANKDKGGIAKKACASACTGCTKCVKVCEFDAITITDNLAYIDADKCRLCRKCVSECGTSAIVEMNFPPRPAPRKEEAAAPVAKA